MPLPLFGLLVFGDGTKEPFNVCTQEPKPNKRAVLLLLEHSSSRRMHTTL